MVISSTILAKTIQLALLPIAFEMAIHENKPHFVLVPFLAQGHMIPMMDIARLLANRSVIVTILTTPHNANRFKPVIARSIGSGLDIHVYELRFPGVEAGLPEGCENFDLLPSIEYAHQFFAATGMLREQVEELLLELNPKPSCLIADMCFPWCTDISLKLHIPRIVFHGMSCFARLCLHMVTIYNGFETIKSGSEYFVIPGLPDKIEITKTQLVNSSVLASSPKLSKMRQEMIEAEMGAFGIVANTFEELEPEYVKDFRKVKGKVWCIGPVSLCNKDEIDKVERGNKAAVDENYCLKWLESHKSSSVIYICLGSISRLPTSQLIELGLGLEASNQAFIWVIRSASDTFKKWLVDETFEDRIKGRGLLIHGWAPQVLILSHPSVGGFLTHCGWNSSLEGITAGVPMITWPVFAEQFCNEKFIVNVIKTGIRAGVEVPTIIGQEENMGVLVKSDEIKLRVNELMDGGEEGEERRRRARTLGERAKRATAEGGCSWSSMTVMIDEIAQFASSGYMKMV